MNINKINKALETLVNHTDNVLKDTDGATDYIFYEVPIECRTDIATYFYDRGNFKDLESTTCYHCHKQFFLIDHTKENPKDVCHCVYERTINPYHGGFNYTNKTAELYDQMFRNKSRLWPSTTKPLVTTQDKDTKWINKHGNKVTISRDFGTNVPVERNLTLGIQFLQDEYNSRHSCVHHDSVMRHVDQDKPATKE
tara:strand:+ start:111 stop:698 length:588 start_codon:yes stop_codon:yes gene_type:complete